MFERQTSGSVVCPSCNKLVGVGEETCPYCGRRSPGLWGFSGLFRYLGADLGFSKVVLGGCGLLYLLSLAMAPQEAYMELGLGFLSPSPRATLLLGHTSGVLVFGFYHVWTVLTAGWLHGSLLHIFFNMYWVRQLAPILATSFGGGRAVLLYIGSSAGGFLTTTAITTWLPWLPFASGPRSYIVGASAAVCGWLGAEILASQRMGGQARTQFLLSIALPLLAIGLFIPGVDNWAHFGGFGTGYLLARWMDPQTEERRDHILWALGAIVLTALAIVFNVLVVLART